MATSTTETEVRNSVMIQGSPPIPTSLQKNEAPNKDSNHTRDTMDDSTTGTLSTPSPSTNGHVSQSDKHEEPLFHIDDTQRKLYGRSQQESMLLEAYGRRLRDSESDKHHQDEFILISGPSGTGKTVLAQVLRGPVAKDGGFFVSGKFDQVLRPEPYGPLVVAFTEFVHQSVTDVGYMEKVKLAAQKALDAQERRVLTNMIPALSEIVGGEEEDEEGSHHDTGSHHSEYNVKHLVRSFQKFATACCSCNRAIVLFVDDLQWADSSSMDLLCSLLDTGVVVVGSCRDNVAQDSPLCIKLRELEEMKIIITNIGVDDLSAEAVNEAVAGFLHSTPERTARLSEVVFQRTHGNVFHVLEYLRFLSREELLHYDPWTQGYSWDKEKIRAHDSFKKSIQTAKSDLIDEMMVQNLLKLPIDVQKTMTVASCIGAKFDSKLLSCALSTHLAAVMEDSLQDAIRAGIITYNGKLELYEFVHDRIQQASYALIPPEKRDQFHLRVGRHLFKRLSPDQMDKYVFIVLNQLQKGSKYVKDQREKYGIASLSLLAGKNALKSSGFRVAAEYLEHGISLLGTNCWREEYDLTISLHNATAEVEFVLANFETMNELLDNVFLHARCFRDKLRAYSTRVYHLGVSRERHQAIDVGFNVLRQLGEDSVPKSPPKKGHILRDVIQTSILLRGKSNESLLRVPLMTDTDKLAAMHMLNLVFPHVYMLQPTYVPFVVCRMVQLSLRHGLCAVSAIGFAGFGALKVGILGAVESGYQYGKLAMSILEKFQTKAWLPRVYCGLYGMVMHWKRPFRFSLEPLKLAYEVGLETGDIEFAMFSNNLHSYNTFRCGRDLHVLEEEVQASVKVMEAHKQDSALMMALPHLQFIRNLMGKCENSIVMTGEGFDEKSFLNRAVEEGDLHNIAAIHCQKLFLGYLFGDYAHAEKMAEQCRNAVRVSMSSQLVPLTSFFDGMNSLALARLRLKRRKRLSLARGYIRKFRKWGTLCPENYLAHRCLLEAEYAAVVGKNDRALVKYTQAISLSAEHSIKYVNGIANERAGHFMQGLNDDERASCYFQDAYTTFKGWGAERKADKLRENIPRLRNLASSP